MIILNSFIKKRNIDWLKEIYDGSRDDLLKYLFEFVYFYEATNDYADGHSFPEYDRWDNIGDKWTFNSKRDYIERHDHTAKPSIPGLMRELCKCYGRKIKTFTRMIRERRRNYQAHRWFCESTLLSNKDGSPVNEFFYNKILLAIGNVE